MISIASVSSLVRNNVKVTVETFHVYIISCIYIYIYIYQGLLFVEVKHADIDPAALCTDYLTQVYIYIYIYI
jgi:hypothetical protein